MNCKPNDLARIVTFPNHPEHIGRVVLCVELCSEGPHPDVGPLWHFESPEPIRFCEGTLFDGTVRLMAEADHLPDAWLLPIAGGSGALDALRRREKSLAKEGE